MSDLKNLLNRINSVNSTKKITRVMQMIATSKLKQARESLSAARFYRDEVLRSLEVFGRFQEKSKTLESISKNRKILIVFSSDRGLCGGYNSSIIKGFRNLFEEFKDADTSFHFIGKKISSCAKQLLGSGVDVVTSEADFSVFRKIIYMEGQNVDFYGFYTKFESAMKMYPMLFKIPSSDSFIFHQNCTSNVELEYKKLFAILYERYIYAQLYVLFKESKVSENMSRMLAMDGATKNAKEVGDKLRRRYNTARQEKITKELIEVVSGAEVI